MGQPSTNKHQIDRIDNNQGYSKENCRWVTSKENNRNRTTNYLIKFNNKTQCLAAWAEEYNINQNTLRNRLRKYGWTIEKALVTPIRKRKVEYAKN